MNGLTSALIHPESEEVLCSQRSDKYVWLRVCFEVSAWLVGGFGVRVMNEVACLEVL